MKRKHHLTLEHLILFIINGTILPFSVTLIISLFTSLTIPSTFFMVEGGAMIGKLRRRRNILRESLLHHNTSHRLMSFSTFHVWSLPLTDRLRIFTWSGYYLLYIGLILSFLRFVHPSSLVVSLASSSLWVLNFTT